MRRGRVFAQYVNGQVVTVDPGMLLVKLDDREAAEVSDIGKIVEIYEKGEEPLTLLNNAKGFGDEIIKTSIYHLHLEEDPLALKVTWRSEIRGLTLLLQRRGPGGPVKQMVLFARQADLEALRTQAENAERKHAADMEVMKATSDKLRELLDDALRRNPAAEAPVRHVIGDRAEIAALSARCAELAADKTELQRYIDEAKAACGEDRVSGEPLAQVITEIRREIERMQQGREQERDEEIDRLVRLNNNLVAQINALNARDERDIDGRARERFAQMYQKYEAEKLAELEKKALAHFDRDLRVVQEGMTNGKKAIDALMQRVKLYAPPEPDVSPEASTDEFDEDDDYYTADEEEGD